MGALVTAAAALSACTTAPTLAPTPAPAPSSSRSVAASPSGSAIVDCATSRPVAEDSPPPSAASDLIIGPLVYPGLARGYRYESAPQADENGIRYFKIGTHLAPRATATVSVGPSATQWAGILTENGPSTGYSSVRYESCPGATDVWWVGGFTLKDRVTACLPLNIVVNGDERHDLVIPIGEIDCDERTP